ncbi:MAG: hypothetical protein IPL40_08875 [Proteobacteria bacterium]|nr:hypothetical protein [Pseudomonadota bacterium]
MMGETDATAINATSISATAINGTSVNWASMKGAAATDLPLRAAAVTPAVMQPGWLASALRPRGGLVVVVNPNARAVGTRVIRQLQELTANDALLISESPEQTPLIARQIVRGGYDTVLCGGGDGTFTRLVTEVLALRPARRPAFGLLRLGTGNALATALGAARPSARGLAADLRCARDRSRRVTLPLLQVEGQLAPFAGVGLDALILEDYVSFKRSIEDTPLQRIGSGPLGYGLAIAGRSLWRYLQTPLPSVVIRNTGLAAYRIDREGNLVGAPLGRGEELYRGPVSLAAASTIPFYGFGLRLFPQADQLRDRFQLRIGHVGAATLLANVPAIFRGSFADERILDFACTSVAVECEDPTALQIGGDLVGRRERVQIGLRQVEAVVGSRGDEGGSWGAESEVLRAGVAASWSRSAATA